MKYLLIICLIVFGQLAIAAENTAAEATDFAVLIAQAEEKFAESKTVGHAWTVTADRLGDARKASAAGDMKLAKANAKEAIKLAELSIQQAQVETKLWQQRVPK